MTRNVARRDVVQPIGQRVRQLRREKGKSQTEIGTVKQNYLASLENGKIKNPSPEKLQDIADGLGVTFAQLVANTSFSAKVRPTKPGTRVWCPNQRCPGAHHVLHETTKIADLECKDVSITDRSPYIAEYEDGEYTVGITSFASFSAYDDDGSPNSFCPYCGTCLISKCWSCGRRLYSGNQRFCMGCRKPVWDKTEGPAAADSVSV